MRLIRNRHLWLVASLLIGLQTASVESFSAPSRKAASDLSDAACQKCHATGQKKIEVPDPNAKPRALRTIPDAEYKKSVHGTLSCVSCHTDIVDAKAKHVRAAPKKVECGQCHIDLLAKAKADNAGAEKLKSLDLIVKNVEAYRRSYHVREDKDRPGLPKASCDECHDTHTFAIPARDSAAYPAFRQTIPEMCGASCHDQHLEDWKDSAHGLKAQAESKKKVAICIDCHVNHEITNTSLDSFKLLYVKECGDCHENQMSSYRDTYHGQVHKLGYTYTAKCSDCHGSHDVLASKDPQSKTHPDNKLKACKKCHDGKKATLATPGFASFGPHANAYERDKYPEVWWVGRLMMAILIGTFIFFWLHCILWYRREKRRGKERRTGPRETPAEVLALTGGKTHVRRFGLPWRILHLGLALSLMALAATGMTIHYAETAWAPYAARLFGGTKSMAVIHRVAAIVFFVVFLTHLYGIVRNLVWGWRRYRIFGPDSLVPRWQDAKDVVGMFRWFVDKGPRPVFDRWTYWEKFDYWAAIWGVFIIGGSGLMLALPDLTAKYLPGWVFNVATMVHGIEAFIATVFLFTVHFFNNHFRPDKLPPPDITMFTGTTSIDELRREHGAHFRRLVESGELKYLATDAPSPAMRSGSRWLGLLLIAMGVLLLVLVLHGVTEVGILPGSPPKP
jgi:cytochrome b subunit of formate dehydrogenase